MSGFRALDHDRTLRDEHSTAASLATTGGILGAEYTLHSRVEWGRAPPSRFSSQVDAVSAVIRVRNERFSRSKRSYRINRKHPRALHSVGAIDGATARTCAHFIALFSCALRQPLPLPCEVSAPLPALVQVVSVVGGALGAMANNGAWLDDQAREFLGGCVERFAPMVRRSLFRYWRGRTEPARIPDAVESCMSEVLSVATERAATGMASRSQLSSARYWLGMASQARRAYWQSIQIRVAGTDALILGDGIAQAISRADGAGAPLDIDELVLWLCEIAGGEALPESVICTIVDLVECPDLTHDERAQRWGVSWSTARRWLTDTRSRLVGSLLIESALS